jgi:hypothetical protein
MALTSGGVIQGRNRTGGGGVRFFKNAGAPTNDTTYVGVAAKGDLLVDTTNGVLYIVTATNGSTTVTYTKVGTQS